MTHEDALVLIRAVKEIGFQLLASQAIIIMCALVALFVIITITNKK